MKTQKLRTPQEIRAEWLRKGYGQNAWAREHGLNPVVGARLKVPSDAH
ncbi:MAG TPA: hypothetical protein PLU47_18190 [Azonexus sp.]|nr:hypothetical protein [Azonexus sp.]